MIKKPYKVFGYKGIYPLVMEGYYINVSKKAYWRVDQGLLSCIKYTINKCQKDNISVADFGFGNNITLLKILGIEKVREIFLIDKCWIVVKRFYESFQIPKEIRVICSDIHKIDQRFDIVIDISGPDPRGILKNVGKYLITDYRIDSRILKKERVCEGYGKRYYLLRLLSNMGSGPLF